MKKIFFIIIGIVIFIVCCMLFFYKHHIRIYECYEIPMSNTEYRPLGYRVFNSSEEYDDFCSYASDSVGLRLYKKKNGFEFDKYSYLIVHGAKVDNLYYSWKTTLFDDNNPTYAKAYRQLKHYLMIDYECVDNKSYLYKIDKIDFIQVIVFD